MDPEMGAPACQVPADHIAWKVRELTLRMDMGAQGKPRSGLGRPAVDRRNYLAVLLYASLIGIHSMTQVAAALVTDAAFRLLSGGVLISASALASFRRESGTLFESAFNQTIAMGVAERFVEPQDLAIDGMRLRAHASTKAVRTRERSQRRLVDLAKKNVEALTGDERQIHDEKVAKHEEAVRLCDERGVTSVCLTNEMASLMKFPSGGSAPGHRIVAAVSGQHERLAVGLLINASPTDYGQLEGAVADTRARLEGAGVPKGTKLRIATDCGFLGEDDQKFIVAQREVVDIVVPPPVEGVRKNGDVEMFMRSDFTRTDDGVVCPAGTPMRPPTDRSKRRQSWTGEGCDNCPLKLRCTKGKIRKFEIDLDREIIHKAIIERYEAPGAREFYKRRMATVEPVFSVLETEMMFVRASSRLQETVRAEGFLKFAAYNVGRLIQLVTERECAAAPEPKTKRRHWRNKPTAVCTAKLRRPRGKSESPQVRAG